MADPYSSTRSYNASAYSLDDEKLLYVERHVEKLVDGRLAARDVTYEDAQGNLIAEKSVRYGSDLATPSFEMTDLRTGLVERAQVSSENVELFSGLVPKEDEAKTVELPESAVIDAGFDAFMRSNFSAVLEGERLDFEFAVPAAGRFFQFRLEPEGRLSYAGVEAIAVKMKPANLFLRLLVDPIELIYDLDGQLLEFRGLSNVADREGDRYKARIVFDYSGSASTSATSEASTGEVSR